MSTYNFVNDGSEHYCLTNVDMNKVYKITGRADGRIYFRYLIMDPEHNKKLMIQAPIDVQNGKFEHIIRSIGDGCLCIRNLKNAADYWKNLTITVEEKGYD